MKTPELYLFCNERYGWPFLETFDRFCRARRFRSRVVMSGKGLPARRASLSYTRQWARRRLRLVGLELRARRRIRLVPDVNAPEFVEGIGPTAHGVIAGFNQIFRPPAIAAFATLVNFHPSLLPYYRGPVPSYWCLQNHERATGFTLHQVTAAIDRGEILHQRAIDVGGTLDPEELDLRIALSAQATLWDWLAALTAGRRWTPVRLDASQIYQVRAGYASFPDRRGRARP